LLIDFRLQNHHRRDGAVAAVTPRDDSYQCLTINEI